MTDSIEVEYKPINKVVVHQYIKYTSMDKFLENVVGQHISMLGWCNGFVYSVGRFAPIDDITVQLMNGTDHIASIYYCPMPEYKASVRNKACMEIQVIDQSNEPLMSATIDYLKCQET